METLDFSFATTENVRIKNDGEFVYIIDKEDKAWMKISSKDSDVHLSVFPKNIPAALIGEGAGTKEELKYNISCNTSERANECKRFLADFIDGGYGEKYNRGEGGWLVGLDLGDLTDVFSENMQYVSFLFDGADIEEVSKSIINIKNAKGIFACVCTDYEEASLDNYSLIVGKIYEEVSEDCNVIQQCVADKSINNKTVIHILYSV